MISHSCNTCNRNHNVIYKSLMQHSPLMVGTAQQQIFSAALIILLRRESSKQHMATTLDNMETTYLSFCLSTDLTQKFLITSVASSCCIYLCCLLSELQSWEETRNTRADICHLIRSAFCGIKKHLLSAVHCHVSH